MGTLVVGKGAKGALGVSIRRVPAAADPIPLLVFTRQTASLTNFGLASAFSDLSGLGLDWAAILAEARAFLWRSGCRGTAKL